MPRKGAKWYGPINSLGAKSSDRANSPLNLTGPVKKFFSVLNLAERSLGARDLERAEEFLKRAEDYLAKLENSEGASESEKKIAREKYTEVEQLYVILSQQEGRSED